MHTRARTAVRCNVPCTCACARAVRRRKQLTAEAAVAMNVRAHKHTCVCGACTPCVRASYASSLLQHGICTSTGLCWLMPEHAQPVESRGMHALAAALQRTVTSVTVEQYPKLVHVGTVVALISQRSQCRLLQPSECAAVANCRLRPVAPPPPPALPNSRDQQHCERCAPPLGIFDHTLHVCVRCPDARSRRGHNS
jgi:hypothetical protein